MPTVRLSWPALDQPLKLPTGETHTVVIPRRPVLVIEIDGRHFRRGSAVPLPAPEPGAGSQDEWADEGVISAFDCLLAAFRHAKKKAAKHVLVAGHCDGGEPAELAEARAQTILGLLKGDRAAWMKGCVQHSPDDLDAIFRWSSFVHGYLHVDISVDPLSPAASDDALANFRREYGDDARFGKKAGEGSAMTDDDWGAVYDLYEQSLAAHLDPESEALADLRGQLRFLAPASVGCGSSFAPSARSAPGAPSDARRVEILLFETDDLPSFKAAKWRARLYDQETIKIFPRTMLEIEPLPTFHFSA
jgi:hypothetical protein